MLKYKLYKWVACLVLLFGALAAILGIWVINQRVVQEAQIRVRYDLSSTWGVYQSQVIAVDTIVRLTAVRGPLVEACAAQRWDDRAAWDAVQGMLARTVLDFHLDFVAVVSPEGRVVVRSESPYRTGDFRNGEPLVARALAGAAGSGTVLLSQEDLRREADGLADRAFMVLQETPHARATPRTSEDRGMAMMAAAPIEQGGRVIGAIYAGVVLNRNQAFVDRIHDMVFGQEKYEGRSPGTVTVFLADTRVATTVRLPNGNRAIGTRVSSEVADRVLDNGGSWVDRAFVVQDWYLTAYDPIRNADGQIIGMLYVGTLEQPFRDLSKTMIWRYSLLIAAALAASLLIAMFIAGRIARPLHRLAESASRMQHGHGFQPVPQTRSCKETAGLILAFNEMAAALTQRERELKEANEHLNDANSSLKATNAHYMETLQFVSHELNSPLSSMMNYAYMLRQRLLGELTDKQANAVEVLTVNLKRLMEMIRHYLNLARIESGEIQPTPTAVAVREEVIAPILASLQADIHAKGMHVEDLVNPKLVLHADLNMTREVFENLLSNAVKYGRQHGLIRLSSRVDGPWAEFAVRNEGEGIPPERRGELFQKFSRIEIGEKKSQRGTGLGLFISKKIVEAHGGAIHVESEFGQWTEFRCTLPVEKPQPRPAPSGGNGAPTPASAPEGAAAVDRDRPVVGRPSDGVLTPGGQP